MRKSILILVAAGTIVAAGLVVLIGWPLFDPNKHVIFRTHDNSTRISLTVPATHIVDMDRLGAAYEQVMGLPHTERDFPAGEYARLYLKVPLEIDGRQQPTNLNLGIRDPSSPDIIANLIRSEKYTKYREERLGYAAYDATVRGRQGWDYYFKDDEKGRLIAADCVPLRPGERMCQVSVMVADNIEARYGVTNADPVLLFDRFNQAVRDLYRSYSE
jgi:hypothetical protein